MRGFLEWNEQVFTRSKLLYPIEKKDYASDEFIESEWKEFRSYLGRAAFFTIFGYSAPVSDKEAIDAIGDAWGSPKERALEEIELIDIRDEKELHAQWEPLIHTHHYEVHETYLESWLGNHPRRGIERYVDQFLEAQFISNDPLPQGVTFDELWASVDELRADEQKR